MAKGVKNEKHIQSGGTRPRATRNRSHGGPERWKYFTTLSVHLINGGVLWGAKGKAEVLDDVTVTVDVA